jgi:hypothetical protein
MAVEWVPSLQVAPMRMQDNGAVVGSAEVGIIGAMGAITEGARVIVGGTDARVAVRNGEIDARGEGVRVVDARGNGNAVGEIVCVGKVVGMMISVYGVQDGRAVGV